MSRARLTPYRQGQLDGLCGIYASINAIRLALGDRGRRFTDEDWQHLFSTLLAAADDAIGAVRATACGMETKPLLTVVKSAVQHMADEHELKVTVKRVLKRKERPPMREFLPRLGNLVEQPSSAVVIALAGALDHWTVLRKVGRTSLELFDSSQFARVKIANCRMSYEQPASLSREHIIHPRAVLRVSVTEA